MILNVLILQQLYVENNIMVIYPDPLSKNGIVT